MIHREDATSPRAVNHEHVTRTNSKTKNTFLAFSCFLLHGTFMLVTLYLNWLSVLVCFELQ